MARSGATTVDQYLAELPTERREVVTTVRDLILRTLPEGYQETMNWGMISYEIPLDRYPKTPNGQPAGYAALAAHKNYFTLYLLNAYEGSAQHEMLEREFEAAGKKLDMGKSCVHFKTLEDLPLEGIGRYIASTPLQALMAFYDNAWKKRTR